MNTDNIDRRTSSGIRQRVLVVDDVASWRELLALRLRMHGRSTLTASSVAEAIGVLELTPVDLVVTDHQMPGPSGLELLAYIHARRPGLPVVIMSAVVEDDLAAVALAGGAAAVVEKSELSPTLCSLVGVELAAA